MKTASLIILNFNGARLLRANLPAVLKAAKAAPLATIVVVADNHSQDESESVVKSFPGVVWLPFSTNYGFGEGNNRAIETTQSDIVVLLNNDVEPAPEFLAPLYLALADPAVFAASCRQNVVSVRGEYFGGGSIGFWERGLLRHRPLEEVMSSLQRNVRTFYADAGASAYRRSMFRELGGFSSVFKPFYWEDADLSFRAWKRGWVSMHVPASSVIHRHETTISAITSSWRKEAIGWRGIFLFTWRAIDSPALLFSHLIWLPFHLVFALVTKRWHRLYGLGLALKSLNERIPASPHQFRTAQVLQLAHPLLHRDLKSSLAVVK